LEQADKSKEMAGIDAMRSEERKEERTSGRNLFIVLFISE